MWGDLLQERIHARQADTWNALGRLKDRLQKQLTVLEQLRPPAETGQWTFYELYVAMDPDNYEEETAMTREFVETYLRALFDAKLLLRDHIAMEVAEILNKRDELILEFAKPVRVDLATADAYAKFLGKCSGGAATAILREKVAEVAFFDEAQAYELDQAAACLSSGTVQTAIFLATPTRLSM